MHETRLLSIRVLSLIRHLHTWGTDPGDCSTSLLTTNTQHKLSPTLFQVLATHLQCSFCVTICDNGPSTCYQLAWLLSRTGLAAKGQVCNPVKFDKQHMANFLFSILTTICWTESWPCAAKQETDHFLCAAKQETDHFLIVKQFWTIRLWSLFCLVVNAEQKIGHVLLVKLD